MPTTRTSAERDFIRSERPRLFVTLSPVHPKGQSLSHSAMLDYANRLLLLVNRQLFKKRFKRGEQSLQGFAVLDEDTNFKPHVHLIITNDLPAVTVREAIEKHAKKFTIQVKRKTPPVRKLRDRYEQGTPHYLIKKQVKSAFYAHSIFGNGSIDVRPIEQAQDDFNRVIRYIQNKPSSVLLLTAESMLVPDDTSGSTVGLKKKPLRLETDKGLKRNATYENRCI